MNATYTYHIATDACMMTLQASDADQAVRLFDDSGMLANVTDFTRAILEVGGWGSIESDDDPELINPVRVGAR